MAVYQELDIRDILSNQRIRTIMPLISSVQKTKSSNVWKPLIGGLAKTRRHKVQDTNLEAMVVDQVTRLVKRIARPYGTVTKFGDYGVRVNVNKEYPLSTAYNNIVRDLNSNSRRILLQNVISHTQIIREVYNQINIKKTTKEERKDQEYKVMVRAISIGQIEKMNVKQIANLEQDIIDSIRYGGGFSNVKKALGYDTETWKAQNRHNIDMWNRNVTQR